MCSNCAGGYEDPDRTAPPGEDEEYESPECEAGACGDCTDENCTCICHHDEEREA